MASIHCGSQPLTNTKDSVETYFLKITITNGQYPLLLPTTHQYQRLCRDNFIKITITNGQYPLLLPTTHQYLKPV